MRISDWSSDVCSSDLGREAARTLTAGRRLFINHEHNIDRGSFPADRRAGRLIERCGIRAIVLAVWLGVLGVVISKVGKLKRIPTPHDTDHKTTPVRHQRSEDRKTVV